MDKSVIDNCKKTQNYHRQLCFHHKRLLSMKLKKVYQNIQPKLAFAFKWILGASKKQKALI